MKTLETGCTPLATSIGNWTALPVNAIHSLFCLHIGYKVKGRWNLGRLSFGRDDDQSLFYNAVLFVRVMFPFWLGIQVRWAGKDPTKKEYLQTGLGWKLNGRFAALFRVQSDQASSKGVSGPNAGQAWGWDDGCK